MPAATMSAQLNGLALFSVEQIELVRRLRNSGITKQQLVQAFDAMDQLDHELGPVYSLPITLQAIQQAAFQRHNVFNAQQAVNVVAANNAAITAAMVAAAAAQQQQQMAAGGQPTSLAQLPTSQANQLPTPPQRQDSSPPPLQQPAQHQQQQPPHNLNHPQCHSPEGFEPPLALQAPKRLADIPIPTPGELVNFPLPNLSNGLMEFPDDGHNYIDEFREFIKLGEQFCCEQIRNFALKYSIKQQQIATLAGVSQSYVSRFLKGDVYEMSERSRRAIQKWYMMYRKNPATIAPAVNAVLITNGSPPKKLAMEMNMASPNGDFVFQPKRERFVFRPNHLEILENYFQFDNYPSQEKREEISQACNNATIAMAGRTLTEKETVTPQIIGNWFANKRKELKKIIKEEGLDVSQVPLRPRGRPCRLLSDLVTMVGQDYASNNSETASTDHSMHDISPNHHSQTNNMADASPQPDKMECIPDLKNNNDASKNGPFQNITNGTMPRAVDSAQITNANGMHHSTHENSQLANGLYQGKEETEKINGPIHNTDGILAKSVNSIYQNGEDILLEQPTKEQDDDELSMSVELAAVNQAILSLTGTQPIVIKPSSAQQTIVRQSLPTTTQMAMGEEMS